MHVITVNIGKARVHQTAKKTETTGIYKQPVSGPVQVTKLDLAGDVVIDKKNHGGPDQAVYIYGQPDTDWWSQEMGRTLEPGSFGENLTIAGLESGVFSIGDRLHIGSVVVLEVTCPRIPCATLAARMGDPFFVKRFRAAERPGLYCRVLQEGSVQAGDPVTYEAAQVETVTLLEMYRDFFQKDSSEASIRRFLAAPIDIRSRQYLEGRLQAVLAQNQDDPG